MQAPSQATSTTSRMLQRRMASSSLAKTALRARGPHHHSARPACSPVAATPESPSSGAATTVQAEDSKAVAAAPAKPAASRPPPPPTPNLFDPAATISRLLTRRFGIVGGLAFVAVLALGEGTEIFKALQEEGGTVIDAADAEPHTLPSGNIYRDLKVGAGASASPGDFVGLHLVVTQLDAAGSSRQLLDTRASGGRPVAFVFGKGRGGALEEGVASMRRGGVRQLELASGNGGLGVSLPGVPAAAAPGSTLRVTVTLEEVSPAYFAN